METTYTQILGQSLTALTPVLVPVIVSALKRGIDGLPKAWLPLIAIVLGAGIETINAYLTAVSAGPVWGAVLGAAGVGVREVLDQTRKGLGLR